MALFNEWGSTASRLEPLRAGSLLFTTKFQEITVIPSSQENVLQGLFRV